MESNTKFQVKIEDRGEEKRNDDVYGDNDTSFSKRRDAGLAGNTHTHTAGNEEKSAGRSFHSPVNCGTAAHICTQIHIRWSHTIIKT